MKSLSQEFYRYLPNDIYQNYTEWFFFIYTPVTYDMLLNNSRSILGFDVVVTSIGYYNFKNLQNHHLDVPNQNSWIRSSIKKWFSDINENNYSILAWIENIYNTY